MKFELTCQTCGWKTGPKNSDGIAKQSLAMHTSRKHGRMKGSPSSKAKKKKSPIVEPHPGCPTCRVLADVAHGLLEALATKPS